MAVKQFSDSFTWGVAAATTYHAKKTYLRLKPRIDDHYQDYAATHPLEWGKFILRLEKNFESLFQILLPLYGQAYDFFYFLENLIFAMADAWIARSADLKKLDEKRENNPTWFQSNQMIGGVCYVNLFAKNLKGIKSKIPYFNELGLTYLHLMPLFRSPSVENDGGYAINSYREVDRRLGTMKELSNLAKEFRKNGISLVLDFVFNHTSNEHEWALKAQQGDPEYQAYYYIFSDREIPDAYEKNLREIFPDEHPGAFTYFPEIQKWVWTTFHSYQWDLNYANPAVFVRMAEELLFLANVGVEVFRLDAVAFIWKMLGTNCENLPQAHQLIQAFNLVARISAPALVFKSEAIVHPDEVVRYISLKECQLSYNPLLMALLWESLGTREVQLLNLALQERFKIPTGCTWVNYVRSHDDIGWTFSDEDAWRLDINGYNHRQFLNSFFTGNFEGSFSRGLPFQENPKTHDSRISGSCASLAGLEKGLNLEGEKEIEMAIRRILLIHSIILTIGGIPLLYLGDEIATLNDYSFHTDQAKSNDSRWVHRSNFDWDRAVKRDDTNSMEGRVFQGLKQVIMLRKNHSIFSGQTMQVMVTNPHVLGYVRSNENQRVLVFANFSEDDQVVPMNQLRIYGLSYQFMNLLTNEKIPFTDLKLTPYQFLVIKEEGK